MRRLCEIFFEVPPIFDKGVSKLFASRLIIITKVVAGVEQIIQSLNILQHLIVLRSKQPRDKERGNDL